MSVNGKRDEFVIGDLLALAESAGIKAKLATDIIAEVAAAVRNWAVFAAEAGVAESTVVKIQNTHRHFDETSR
jgi:serine/threonine-protein kinase HipA